MSPRSRFCGPARQGGAIGLIAAFQTASRSATKFFQGYIGGRQRDEWRHITHHHRLASLVFGIRDGFFNHGGGAQEAEQPILQSEPVAGSRPVPSIRQ
ncbi:hypothetical protein D3C71_1847180 [compost metagenome]